MQELVSTFSIVAFDEKTGELGVAVQSKAFNVGTLCPWAKAGVGAVSTQSLVNVSLGPKGLELLEKGLTPEQVLEEFRKLDENIEVRQLGIVDAKGNALTFTGNRCIPWAGGKTGKGYAVQGNILAGEEVVTAMAEAFEKAEGSLATRLMAALAAGQAAGGDIRGKQSAALIIEKEGEGRAGYGSRKIDLRVDDNPEPIEELARLLRIVEIHQKFFEIQQGAGEKTTVEEAVAEMKQLIEKFDGPTDELWISLGTFQHRLGQLEDATASFVNALRINPNLIHLVKHYPSLGFLDEEFIKRVEDEFNQYQNQSYA